MKALSEDAPAEAARASARTSTAVREPPRTASAMAVASGKPVLSAARSGGVMPWPPRCQACCSRVPFQVVPLAMLREFPPDPVGVAGAQACQQGGVPVAALGQIALGACLAAHVGCHAQLHLEHEGPVRVGQPPMAGSFHDSGVELDVGLNHGGAVAALGGRAHGGHDRVQGVEGGRVCAGPAAGRGRTSPAPGAANRSPRRRRRSWPRRGSPGAGSAPGGRSLSSTRRASRSGGREMPRRSASGGSFSLSPGPSSPLTISFRISFAASETRLSCRIIVKDYCLQIPPSRVRRGNLHSVYTSGLFV